MVIGTFIYALKCGLKTWHDAHGRGATASDPPPLVGFAARSESWRYVAWMRHNGSLDAVDWSARPYAEELFYHPTAGGGEPPPAFDHWDRENLLATGGVGVGAGGGGGSGGSVGGSAGDATEKYQGVAATHLEILASVSKRRRGLLGKYAWGIFDERLEPKQRLLHQRAEPPAFASSLTFGPDIPAK